MNQPMNSTVSADVRVEAVPATRRSQAELEADVFRVLDALNGPLGDVVIGPAAAVNFEKGSLEFEFTVEGASDTEIQRRVTSVIEQLPLAGEGRLSTSTAPATDDYCAPVA